MLANGNIMVQQSMRKVVEIEPKTKKVVWSYDSTKQNGNEGKRVEVHAFQPLADGKVMIAESGPGRIIEVDREGNIHHEIKLKLNRPHPHRDTRLARKLNSGNYLVCHEGDGFVREYNPDGDVVWDQRVKPALPESSRVRDHGYAAPTPATDGQHIYVFFGKTGVFKFDLNGNQIWQADVGSNTHGWGCGTSPGSPGPRTRLHADDWRLFA